MMNTIVYRISKRFWKKSFYDMVCYAMLSYAMVWYGKYGMLWDFNALLWDFYAMLWFMLLKISIAQLYMQFHIPLIVLCKVSIVEVIKYQNKDDYRFTALAVLWLKLHLTWKHSFNWNVIPLPKKIYDDNVF